MRKRRNWKKFSAKCGDNHICDCGSTEICEDERNEEGICEKDLCPIWHLPERQGKEKER